MYLLSRLGRICIWFDVIPPPPLTQDSEPRLVETLQEIRLPEDLPSLVQRESAQALHVVPVQDPGGPLGGGEARLSVHQQGHAGRQPLLCAQCVVCIR